jgi:ABC-type multidrug transport system fused ATPase/permease subunit
MPPRVPHAEPGEPDLRGPLRYIWWLARRQPARILRGGLFGTAWMVGLTVRPWLLARAVDDGLRRHDDAALLFWVGCVLAAGMCLAYLGIMRHRTMTFVREDATARSAEVLLRHLATVGGALPRRLKAGDVATVSGYDIGRVSMVLTFTGPGIGAVIAYAVVAVTLWRMSPVLAVCVLLGVPAVTLAVGPFLRRLDHTETVYRQQQGELTSQAGDIVAGLRILAGVGGRGLFADRYTARSRALRAEGYRVGAVASWVGALTIAVPGLFLGVVVWLSARLAAGGDITVGQLVAVYGYTAILVVPVWFLLESASDVIRGRVSARRIIALLSIAPDPAGAGAGGHRGPARPADLTDPDSGLSVRPGELLGVVTAQPGEALALADRLGRHVPSGVRWGGHRLAEVDVAVVRARILVADPDAYLFAGTLREILRIRPGQPDATLTGALRTASATDVLDALPDGLDNPVGARGRTLSGGQRQRIRLARALLAEPEILILVDPTSAVDVHTEARIGQRLRAARAGRTTVVLCTSPLLLDLADRVAYLERGAVVASGSHADLLATVPGYRAVVSRAEADDAPSDGALPDGVGRGAVR